MSLDSSVKENISEEQIKDFSTCQEFNIAIKRPAGLGWSETTPSVFCVAKNMGEEVCKTS
jgi:hypothetical protein